MPKAKTRDAPTHGKLGHPYGLVPGDADLSHIAEGLRHLAVPVSLLCHDPANPRRHDERGLRAIRDSLRRFGQDQPLVVQRDGLVVRKGNGRLDAAVALGWEHVAAVVVDEASMRAALRGLADNRSAELSTWDLTALAAVLANVREQGEDPAGLGWDPPDVDLVSAALASAPPKKVGEVGGGLGETAIPAASEATLLPGEAPPTWGRPITLTCEQRQTVDLAVRAVRTQTGREDMSEGRAIELVCADYLSGAPLHH